MSSETAKLHCNYLQRELLWEFISIIVFAFGFVCIKSLSRGIYLYKSLKRGIYTEKSLINSYEFNSSAPLFPARSSRGLYVKQKLLNNKRKGVNHEISYSSDLRLQLRRLEIRFTTRRTAWSHHLSLNPQKLKALQYAVRAWKRNALLLHLFQSRLWTFKISCDLKPKTKRR